MSLRDRRITSAMTPEARAKAAKMEAEGRDPVTGRKPGKKTAPCPNCEIPVPPKKGGGNGGGLPGGSGTGPGGGGGGGLPGGSGTGPGGGSGGGKAAGTEAKT